MKTIFDQQARNEMIQRINTVNENSTAQWGKMNAYQMLRHCRLCDEYYQGKFPAKRSLLGRFVGAMALKNILKEGVPFQKNAPTSPLFKVTEAAGNLDAEKQQWISLIEAYANYPEPAFIHWFFGKMTKAEVGEFVWKHNDHHLRQFGS